MSLPALHSVPKYHVDFILQEPVVNGSQAIAWRRARTVTAQLSTIPLEGMFVDLGSGKSWRVHQVIFSMQMESYRVILRRT